jgi:cobalt-zinc-cadmium efflux system outer membrane protein
VRAIPACVVLVLAGCASGPEPVRPPSPNDPATPAAAPEAGAAEPLPDLAGPVRLADLLPLLLRRNPGVRAARARLEAAAERYPQAISLPDPMVEATWYTKNAMDPEGEFPRWDLMLRQEFPLPNVLILRGEAATKEAEGEALRYEAAVRDAVAELKDVEAERAYLAAAARVQSALRDVYRRYAEVARGGAESGRTRLPESFRAEALLAQAGYELTLVDEVRRVEDQRLRALLALPAAVALGDPADAPQPAGMDANADELARRALAYNQELREAGVDVEVAQLRSRLARWDYAPTFSLGAGLMKNDEIDHAAGTEEDSTVVTLGISIPLWLGTKAAAVREADAKLRAAQAAAAGQRERVLADVARLSFRLRNAGRLATLYGRELVPQAEKALVRSQAMVQEGSESLSSSLELAATWQQLRIAELRAQADQAQAVAALERLLGTSLVAAPSPEPPR